MKRWFPTRLSRQAPACEPPQTKLPLTEERPVGIVADTGESVAQQLMDVAWYRQKHPDVASSGMDPFQHYLTFGVDRRIDPCRFFWTGWYLDNNADVAAAGLNPLLHFAHFGAAEGRNPSPLFDTAWYASNNPDVAGSGINPLLHYIMIGQEQGRAARQDLAIEAFRLGRDTHATARVTQVLSAAIKAENSGKNTLFQGTLKTGRQYLTERGLPVSDIDAEGSLGRQVSSEMKAAGIFKELPYFAQFRNVTIIPGSATLIPEEGIAINDEIADNGGTSSDVECKLWGRTWAKNGELLVRYTIELSPRIETGLHLFKEYEQNYFHFIFEVVTKLLLVERDGLVPHDVPILISDDLDDRLYDLVEAVKHPERPLLKLKRNVPYVIGTLFYVSDVARILDSYESAPDDRSTFMSDTLTANVSEQVLRVHRREGFRKHRRLFVSRVSERRGLVNQRDVIEQLLELGFETVTLEQLNIASQVNLFSEADIVVGATGASFANMTWCSPGTNILILYPDHPLNNRTFWNAIARAKGLNISYLDGKCSGEVLGRHAMHDSFSIDVDELRRRVLAITQRE